MIKAFFPKVKVSDNVEYVLRGADGRIKPIFQENWMAKMLLKAGFLSPRWILGSYAPLIAPFLGHMAMQKKIGNLITTVGFALAAGRLMGSGSPAAATGIAVGTGATAANIADTTLQTELSTDGLSRGAGSLSLVTTGGANDTAQATITYTVSGSHAVTESGILNNVSSGGTLLCRQVFSAINVVSGDTLAITWKVQMH